MTGWIKFLFHFASWLLWHCFHIWILRIIAQTNILNINSCMKFSYHCYFDQHPHLYFHLYISADALFSWLLYLLAFKKFMSKLCQMEFVAFLLSYNPSFFLEVEFQPPAFFFLHTCIFINRLFSVALIFPRNNFFSHFALRVTYWSVDELLQNAPHRNWTRKRLHSKR